MYNYADFKEKSHRLIPSRYPPVSLFDWVESPEELEQLALLEGMSNDRLSCEYGHIQLVAEGDWVGGPGSTPLMAAFTHFGVSRFSDGTDYGVYYAADSIYTAIAETKFHRERFLSASNEPPCLTQMRDYISYVTQKLVSLCDPSFADFCSPDLNSYHKTQQLGREIKLNNEWGILYPSARKKDAHCVAIFRPTALTLPIPAGHYDYIWDGKSICEVRQSLTMKPNLCEVAI